MKSKGYYINIVNINNLWCFQLWYKGKQAMGSSIGYTSIDECKKSLKYFQKFLLDNTNITENKKLLKIQKTQDNKYVYNLLYYSRSIETEYNCKKSAISTYKNLPHIIENDRIRIIY